MSATPEGKVKDRIKKVLNSFEFVYYHMPVQNGMGAPTLDFVGCCRGTYFTIEAKAPGKDPTPRQLNTAKEISEAWGAVFFIDGERDSKNRIENSPFVWNSYEELFDWLADRQ